jgi:geranylgeranyl diphosphate synthase type II
MDHEANYAKLLSLINDALENCFPRRDIAQEKLFEAMRYSLLAGGKRIRPVLLIEFCRACGGSPQAALPFALAIEMIHTYSLIHDDLPCMDNDMLRRGRPTNHLVYGEGIAVLAGDALLNAAFELMLTEGPSASVPPDRAIEAARVIAEASGACGMIGGQILDIENEGSAVDPERIELTDRLKTGAIIRASCEAGCILAGADTSKRQAAVEYAQSVGLAFQITDDLLNLTGTESDLGKPVGSDADRGKMTYIKAYGIDACKRMVDELTEKAKKALDCFEENDFLLWLTDYLAARRS